jgi:membrane protein
MNSPEWVAGARERVSQVMRLVAKARDWAERTIFWRVWERMLENEFIDRGIALAAKAFVSFFPAIIVVAAFAPPAVRAAIVATITRHAGLSGPGLATFHSAFATASNVRRATGVLGLVFTVYYINSFTSALQRAYIRAWRRPPSSLVYGYALGATWLVGILAYLTLIGGMRAAFGRGPGLVLFAVLALAAAIGLWWVTSWVMLGRQVRLRVLLPTAVLTGLGMTVYGAASSLWMPTTVSQNQHQFGFFGVALAMVTWLSGAAFIIVASACAAPVLAEDRGVLGRLVRGSDPAVLVPGAVPSLGAPLRAPTLSNAIGIGPEAGTEPGPAPAARPSPGAPVAPAAGPSPGTQPVPAAVPAAGAASAADAEPPPGPGPSPTTEPLPEAEPALGAESQPGS